MLVCEARTRQQRNSAACSTCASWWCLMATFLPLQPTECKRGKLESSNFNDITGTSFKEIPVASDWLRSKNFRGLLLTDQVKLLRSQWIETFLICLFGWDLACSSPLVDGKSTFWLHGISWADLNQANNRLNSCQGHVLQFTKKIQNVYSAMKSCLQNYDHLFPLIQPCSQWTILQLSAQWPGLWMAARLNVTLFWYRPHCFCRVNEVVLMLIRCIYTTKVERSVSKQGHLQPRCHSKARSLSRQL